MAQYTVLNKEDINSIMVQYDVENVTSYKVLSGGSENTNYLVVTKTGKYVLTICEQRSAQKTSELVYLLEHLASHDFATSKIIRTANNEPITYWNNKAALLKAYIPGQIIEDLSSKILEFLGQELGKLHKIEVPDYLPNKVSYGKESFKEIELYANNSSFHNWLNEIYKYIMEHISPSLPKALIHSDIFYNNVIVNDDETSASIMDFEEASYYYRVFDIGMTIIGLCSEMEMVNLEKVSFLLKGYKREIKLQGSELNSLKAFTVYAAAATAFWRHKQFHYTQPDPAMLNHYLTMRNLADHVKGLPDDCFIKLINN